MVTGCVLPFNALEMLFLQHRLRPSLLQPVALTPSLLQPAAEAV